MNSLTCASPFEQFDRPCLTGATLFTRSGRDAYGRGWFHNLFEPILRGRPRPVWASDRGVAHLFPAVAELNSRFDVPGADCSFSIPYFAMR